MKLIAHRGGSGLRVENTLGAFANAIALGAAGAELDVHLSRDGQVVVHHDDRLNPAYCRHAGGDWIRRDEALPLASLPYDVMRQYDIGTPRPGTDYAGRFERIQPIPDQHIPLLREVIRLVKARSDTFLLVIEFKTPPLEASRRRWIPLVDSVLDVIEQEAFFERSIVCSFDWESLIYAKQRHPQLATWFTSAPFSWFADGQPPPVDLPPGRGELDALRAGYASGDAPWYAGFDPRRFDGSHARAVAAAGGNAWFPYYRDFTREAADELADAGLASAVWSVNLREPAAYSRLAQAGANYCVMDYPDLVVSD